MVTDSMRALLLETCGYEAQVFEFVSLEHTSKNKMILAKRRGEGAGHEARARSELADLKSFYGIREQCLETLLESRGAPRRASTAPRLRPARRRSPLRAGRCRARHPCRARRRTASGCRPRRAAAADARRTRERSDSPGAGHVTIEAQVGVEAGHADVDERLAEPVAGVGAAKARHVPDPVGELDDVDAVVMRARPPRCRLGGRQITAGFLLVGVVGSAHRSAGDFQPQVSCRERS